MVCYGHGIFGNCCYVIGFMMYSEEGVNQGSGVVGGWVLDMLIFHWLY